MTSQVSADEINAFFKAAFTGDDSLRPRVILMEKGRAVVKLEVSQSHIRPGNYISGPTQMGLADQAAYAAVFTEIGVVPVAVTSNLNINFLRPCKGRHVEAEAKIIKLGRTLAIMEVSVRADENDKPASHAVVTYAIPAK